MFCTTTYHHRDEGGTLLAAQAPDLHERLQEVAEQGWSHVVLDEGTNRLVKHVKRAARGLRNPSNDRRRLRLHGN